MTEGHNGAEVIVGESKDEVLRKLGRNLLLFQKAEQRLKWLAERMHVSGMGDELEAVIEKRRDDVAKDTLGGARRRLTERATLTREEQEKIESTLLEKGGVHLGMSFSFYDKDGEPDTAWHERVESLVEARNDFVHHFHGRFDLASREGCEAAARHLDEQHAEFVPVVADLGRRCEQLAQAAELHAAALKQDDIRAEFLHGHLRVRLEEVLRRLAAERARGDGWTYLNHVGQELAAAEPDLLKHLREAFGHSGLKEAVAAMDQFELCVEPTDSGVRVLYRGDGRDG